MKLICGALLLGLLSACAFPFLRAEALQEGMEPEELKSYQEFYLNNARNGLVEPHDFLSAQYFPELQIEVDYFAGFRPSEQALETLLAIAERYCEKPGGIRLVVDEQIPLPAKGERTRDALRELGRKHCGLQASAGVLPLYILYADYFPGRGTLATADAALPSRGRIPSILMYREVIEANARLHISGTEIETHTLVHEFGHLLGLAENPAHQAKNAAFHCTRPECAVAGGLTTGKAVWANFVYNPFRLIFGNMPKDYCVECQADLRVYRKLERVFPQS
jgi:predicted outer membrane lipoprotein